MSLIFDSFPNEQSAVNFANKVHQKYGLEVKIFQSEEEAQKNDPTIAGLIPPIVHVQRWKSEKEYQKWLDSDTDNNREEEIEEMVEEFGGEFVGT